MTLSRRAAAFLLAFGGWTWVIWPRFLLAVVRDDRAFDDGPTSFLVVHAVLIAVSLAAGTAIGVLGWRGVRARSGGCNGVPDHEPGGHVTRAGRSGRA